MDWNALPEPGSEYGPCKDACEHKDCAWTRKVAESICRFCNKPIGYDRGFYQDTEKPFVKKRRNIIRGQLEESYVHSSCAQKEAENGYKSL